MFGLKKAYSPHQFSFVRIMLGLYLFGIFYSLFPYIVELYSTEGMMAGGYANGVHDLFKPAALFLAAPVPLSILLLLAMAASLLFASGVFRRAMALFLWFIWFGLYNLNTFSADPSLGYIGLLLLVCTVVPSGEPLSLKANVPAGRWYMPSILFWGLWLVWGLSFTISGYSKIESEVWREGMALYHFYSGTLAADTVVSRAFALLPLQVGMCITWIILYTQLLALPAIFFRRTRQIFWVTTFTLFFGSLFVVQLVPVVLGMLIFYLFLFDSQWFARRYGSATLFIDTDCVHCVRFGRFVQTEDLSGRIKIASIYEREDARSMLYEEDGQEYVGAEAFIQVVSGLGGIWISVRSLRVFPPEWRTAVYGFLARNRYRLSRDRSCERCGNLK